MLFRRANGDHYKSPLPTGTSGAVSELVVCVDLLRKGYEVFRAVSPSCSCDLAVLKNGQLVTIEVRTGYYTHRGALMYSKKNARASQMAIVTFKEIIYEPPL